MKVIAATGGSRHALRAIRLASRLLKDKSDQLSVLVVAELGVPMMGDAAMKAAQASIKTLGIAAQVLLAHGRPAEEIRREAARGHDLLVIGARGTQSVRDFFLGENAVRLIRNCPIPTLVVRRRPRITRVLWRVPESGPTQREEAVMGDVLARTAAPLSLLVVHPQTGLFGYDRDIARYDEPLACRADTAVGALRARMEQKLGVSVGCHVRYGIPEEAVIDEAARGGFDLIAVSVRRRRFGRLFGENLAYRVAQTAPVSVLVFGSA